MRRALLALLAAALLPLPAAADKLTVAVVDFERLADSLCAKEDAGLALALKMRGNSELKVKEEKAALAVAGAHFKRTGEESGLLTLRARVAEAEQDLARSELMVGQARQAFAVRSMPKVRDALKDKGYAVIVARAGLVQAPPGAQEVNATDQVLRSCK